MAQIKINSKIVIEACENWAAASVLKLNEALKEWNDNYDPTPFRETLPIPSLNHTSNDHVKRIKDLAQYSEDYGLLDISIDHDDFNLIGEFLPKPTTYSTDQGST